MKNRILAIILCTVLVFSLSSMFCGVFAQQENGDDEIVNGDESTSSEDAGATEDDKSEGSSEVDKSEGSAEITEDESEDDDSKFSMDFHPEGFIELTKYMGIGMLGIFIIIGLIAIATIVINKLFSGKPKKENE